MAKTPAERYIDNHAKAKAKALAKILASQKADFVRFLEGLGRKSAFFVRKAFPDDELDDFVDGIASEIPEYLVDVLPRVMNDAAREPIKQFSEFLPAKYALSFDVESGTAAKYLRELEDLMLSQKDGSVSKTTRDELRRIMADGVEAGFSYGEIAKQVEDADPFVFSASRARTIAANEVGRAYGWANHEPSRFLTEEEGYEMMKKWRTSNDDKVRETHMENEEA